jgi:type VI secretion system secreted protein VgrG
MQQHADAMDPKALGRHEGSVGGQEAKKAVVGSRALGDAVERFAQPLLHLDTPASATWVTPASISIFSGQDSTLTMQGDAHLTSAHTLSSVSGQTTSLYTHAGGIKAITANAGLSLRAHTDAMQIWADKDITVQSTTDEIRIQASGSIALNAGQSQVLLEGGNITFTCPGTWTVKGASHDWMGGGSQAAMLPQMPEGAMSTTGWTSPLSLACGLEVDVGALFANDPSLLGESVEIWSTGDKSCLLGQESIDDIGRARLIHSPEVQDVEVVVGEGQWYDIEDIQNDDEGEGEA